jgi:hypothetical protein
METLNKTIISQETYMNKISIKSGIFTSLGLISYFMIMRVFNLHYNLMLHYLNIIVLFFGLRYSIKHIKLMTGDIKYFEGLKSGVIVSLISVLTFNLFLLIYTIYIDKPFYDFLNENISFGNLFSYEETIFGMMGLIIIEGLSSGFIMTYILMQYYKSENSETE